MTQKNFITEFGMFSTIVITMIGVGSFSYPEEVVNYLGSNGWIGTIVEGILVYFLIYIAYKVIKLNGYNKLCTILQNSFGKIFGSILALIFVAYNIFFISMGMRIFIEVIKMYLLEKTPSEFLIIVMIFTGIYLIRNELGDLIKFNEISFWIMFVSIGLIFLFTLNKTHFNNSIPNFINSDVYDYLKAFKNTIYSFIGIEIIYLVGPFAKNKGSIRKIALKSILFVTLFYVVTVILSLAIFSEEQTKTLLWPTITMIKSVDIRGAFIERWEGIAMAVWIMFYFCNFSNVYYLSSDIVKDVFRLGDIKISSALIAPFIYLTAMYPENIAELYHIINTVMPVAAAYSLILLPLIIFLFSKPKRNLNASKFICIFLVCTVLTGCWDKVEIERTQLVSVIGVDAGEDIGKVKELKNVKSTNLLMSVNLKKIHVTFGTPDLSKLEPGKGGISGDKYVDVDGYSMEDAVNTAMSKSSRTVKFSQTKLLVLGKGLMEYPDVVKEVIDYLQREPSLNRNMYIVLASGSSDKYIKIKTPMGKSTEDYILGLVEGDAKDNEVKTVTLNDFLVSMSENGNSIIPKVEMDKDKKNIKIAGTAAIKNFKYEGDLNQVQTSNIQLLQGKLKNGKRMIYLEGHPVDIRINDSNRRIKVSQEKGNLVFNIKLNIEGEIKNYYTNGKVLSVDKLSYIEQSFNKAISQECKDAIKVTQRDLKIDPIGFKDYIKRYHPLMWRQVKDKWEDSYKDAVVNVNVDTKIRRIGVVK
ncbi:Ger(x)C family spore germination protein [Clostridium ljungdahlii]|uniref:Ger(x)C family spore germination protein n=1 Tax=Clostridium ljungdahlii TaxID=1538 RepID=UPI00386ED6D5